MVSCGGQKDIRSASLRVGSGQVQTWRAQDQCLIPASLEVHWANENGLHLSHTGHLYIVHAVCDTAGEATLSHLGSWHEICLICTFISACALGASRCYKVVDAGRDQRDYQSFNISFVSYRASSLTIASSYESSWSCGAVWLFIQQSCRSYTEFCLALHGFGSNRMSHQLGAWNYDVCHCFWKAKEINNNNKKDAVHSLV